MNVPLFDTKSKNNDILLSRFNLLLNKGKFVLGENLKTLEDNLAKFLNSKYVVGVNSGTDALEISLKCLGIKNGDVVITSGFTYFATIEAIHNVGGIPYLADINRDSLQIDLHNLDKNILNKAKFIIPVHLFGGYVNIEELLKISKNFNLKIVEDVAQSFGTKVNGKFLGNFGHTGAFSFYPTKTLGAMGDAGAITTNSKKLYEDILKMRNHGHIDRNNFKFSGRNSRLDEIQAIYLNLKLQSINKDIASRKHIADEYHLGLKHIKDLKFYNDKLQTFNYYPIVTKTELNRNQLVNFLKSRNIETAIYYKKPLTDLNFSWIAKGKSYKNIDYIKKRILCLPIYPNLSKSKLSYTIKSIREFYEA